MTAPGENPRKRRCIAPSEQTGGIGSSYDLRSWVDDNRAAIEASNAWFEKHGLPLAKYRQF